MSGSGRACTVGEGSGWCHSQQHPHLAAPKRAGRKQGQPDLPRILFLVGENPATVSLPGSHGHSAISWGWAPAPPCRCHYNNLEQRKGFLRGGSDKDVWQAELTLRSCCKILCQVNTSALRENKQTNKGCRLLILLFFKTLFLLVVHLWLCTGAVLLLFTPSLHYTLIASAINSIYII